MTDFEITHVRKECIGCGLCASMDSNKKYWAMDETDLKSNLVGGKEVEPGIFKRTVKGAPDGDLELNEKIQEACPVQVIKVEKMTPATRSQ